MANRAKATGVINGNDRVGHARVYSLEDVAMLVDRVQFLKRRLELILRTTRETHKPEADRRATCEHEAEHCLGVAKDW